jgi:hypothetical protein
MSLDYSLRAVVNSRSGVVVVAQAATKPPGIANL